MAGWLSEQGVPGPEAVTASSIEAAFRGPGVGGGHPRPGGHGASRVARAPPSRRGALRPTWSTGRGPRRRRCRASPRPTPPRSWRAWATAAGADATPRGARPGPARPGAHGGALRQRPAPPGGVRPGARRARLRARVAARGGQGRPGADGARSPSRRWPPCAPGSPTGGPRLVSGQAPGRGGAGARVRVALRPAAGRLHGLPRGGAGAARVGRARAARTCCATRRAPTCSRGRAASGGAHLRVVQEVLGHASLATTQRYTGVTTKSMQAALRRGHPRG